MRDLPRRLFLSAYRLLRHPRRLKQSRLNAWLGKRVLDRQLWIPTRDSVAGGLALGVFLALQPLPFQMIAAAVLACWFRVNLTIAIAACWITNPVTAGPLFLSMREVGEFLGATLPLGPVKGLLPDAAGLRGASQLLTATVLCGALGALIAYGGVFVLWSSIEQYVIPKTRERLIDYRDRRTERILTKKSK